MGGLRESAGRWQELTLASAALAGNPLGDPCERPLFVLTPPGYDAQPQRRYPTVYVLHGMTAQARAFFNVAPFAPTVAAQLEQTAPEAIVVLVDGFTSLGGAQWVDSPATGAYGTYLCRDVIEAVDGSFRTLPEAAHRGIAGSSSGGFGATYWALRRPDLFAAFASHAGDCLFAVTLAAEFAPAAQALRNLYQGSFERFWDDFRSGRPVLSNATDPLLQNLYATAAAFSPGAGGTVELPFDLETGTLRPEAWSRWLACDPVLLAAERREAVRGLRGAWVDAGRHDEYRLDLGASALRSALLEAGLPPASLHFELFDGGHRGLGRRLPLGVSFLADRLAA